MASVPNLTPLKTKYADIRALIDDEEAWASITNYIDEAVKCKQKIEHEQQNIRALRESVADKHRLHPKLFNAVVAATYNNDYINRLGEIGQQQIILQFLLDNAEADGVELEGPVKPVDAKRAVLSVA